jgi:hypothetical protein
MNNDDTRRSKQKALNHYLGKKVDLQEFEDRTLKGMNDLNKDFTLELPDLSGALESQMNKVSKSILLQSEIRQAKEKMELDYKESVVNALQGIEKNTALLTEMTLLLQKNNDKQDELFQLMLR